MFFLGKKSTQFCWNGITCFSKYEKSVMMKIIVRIHEKGKCKKLFIKKYKNEKKKILYVDRKKILHERKIIRKKSFETLKNDEYQHNF